MPINATPGVDISPSGQLRSSYNFISDYDYAIQYEPNKMMKIHPRYGNGLITGFIQAVAEEKPYNSDQVLHTEQKRLMQQLRGVTRAGDVFTTSGGENHNLRVNDTVILSDGTVESQGIVSVVNDNTSFTLLNKSTDAWTVGPFTANCFSNEWGKGEPGFTQGKTRDYDTYYNYSHIIKEYYDVSESDMAHAQWLQTPEGQDVWHTHELNRTRAEFQNKMELTHLFNERAEAGSDAANAGKGGLDGVIPVVKRRGIVGTGELNSIDYIDSVTKRIRREGGASVYTGWADQSQRIAISNALGAVNQYTDTGANYGVFGNSKDLALHLDFHSFTRNGITFHMTDWKLLNDPTLLGGGNFEQTNISSLFIPAGEKKINDDTGAGGYSPYINVRYRKQGNVNRYMRTKIFGLPGTEIREDKMEIQYISEMTNQVVGANEYVLINRG